MFKKTLIFSILMSAPIAFAATDVNLKDAATKMVPNAKIIKEDGNEFDLQTAKGTVVEVELNRDGTIDEASGDSVAGGDEFAPGAGMMTLAQAAEALRKAGKNPTGDWSFEKSMMHGWMYEFEGMENGKKMEYGISAKDGKLVKEKRDLM